MKEATHSEEPKAKDESEDKSSIATKLVNLTETQCELFTDQDGESYARLPIEGHHEVYRIDSKEFGDWLKRTFYRTESTVPNDCLLYTSDAADE
mgnify:CR=1 FL=1